MTTQMASNTSSGQAIPRQQAATSGSGGRNPDRNNGDQGGPGKRNVKKLKENGKWCVFCRRWGHEAAKCPVGARVLAGAAAASQIYGPPHPPSPPRPRERQRRPRMEGNSRDRRRERRRQQRLQQQVEEDHRREIEGQEDLIDLEDGSPKDKDMPDAQ
ncbi:hypothetical protein CNMCM5793_001624 [Aspergillus hiratsukae]|uniref:Uncharacterized protein n=1 Tax=Aspergillus hiratsukae TaxID=1194566 RepID=A0A8H6PCP9_9EURO|nr:hypothetical protein CNMCM5793_001624 [Aspergillus hiratsukae]KAF7165153.1 hypothetical protein CNMCM6106_001393 [Aspergillus hiratsukae]